MDVSIWITLVKLCCCSPAPKNVDLKSNSAENLNRTNVRCVQNENEKTAGVSVVVGGREVGAESTKLTTYHRTYKKLSGRNCWATSTSTLKGFPLFRFFSARLLSTMAPKQEYITLSNGVKMPAFGLGTWQAKEGVIRESVKIALDKGYHQIDTARAYQNEDEIGEALQEAFKKGLKREDVFVVTKTDFSAQDNEFKVEEVWKGMEKVYDLKLARAIGVSNFNIEQLERVRKSARIPIHNNQVECHLYFNQKELFDYQKKHNISLTAYSPLGSPGRNDVVLPGGKYGFAFKETHSNGLENPVVKRIAAAHNQPPAAVLLRFLIQRGIAVVPKSSNAGRITDNLKALEFQLSDAEVQELLNVPQEKRIFKMDFLKGSHEDPFANDR